jgi:hypothetical protein
MPDPVSRLQFTREEIDRVLGQGFSAAHPELVGIVMQSATMEAARLAAATPRPWSSPRWCRCAAVRATMRPRSRLRAPVLLRVGAAANNR